MRDDTFPCSQLPQEPLVVRSGQRASPGWDHASCREGRRCTSHLIACFQPRGFSFSLCLRVQDLSGAVAASGGLHRQPLKCAAGGPQDASVHRHPACVRGWRAIGTSHLLSGAHADPDHMADPDLGSQPDGMTLTVHRIIDKLI